MFLTAQADADSPADLTREQYIALSDELEHHELAHAAGQETDYT